MPARPPNDACLPPSLKEYLDQNPTLKNTLVRRLLGNDLPELGRLRYDARLKKVDLVSLVHQHGHSSRKAFENAKPYADVLELLGPQTLPREVYYALTYREARKLSKLLKDLWSQDKVRDAVNDYIRVSKFQRGWVDFLCSKIGLLCGPSKVLQMVPKNVENTVPDVVPNNPDIRVVQKSISAAEFLESVAILASRLSKTSSEVARNNLARAVNDAEAWNLFRGT